MIYPPFPPPPFQSLHRSLRRKVFKKIIQKTIAFQNNLMLESLWIYEIKVMDLLDKVLFKNYFFSYFHPGKKLLKNTFRV